jgi:hypothetical protein
MHLETLEGLHHYGSVPEAGRPGLPFIDDSIRKSTEEPFFAIPDEVYEVPRVPLDQALVALDPTKVALLIETRPLPHLPALLLHFISVLPLEWTIRFMGSPEAIRFLQSSRGLRQQAETGKLVFSEIPPEYSVSSQEDISATLTDLYFYRDILEPAEWLLVFQADSMVCAASTQSLNDWVALGYTWIGAPWNLGNEYGGNGGLSLRHLPPIIALLEEESRLPNSDWEDRWLCDRLGVREDALMPTPEVERHFSVESIWADEPFGYHLRGSGKLLSPEVWGSGEKKSHIYEYCPEIKMVLDIGLEEVNQEVNIAKKLDNLEEAAQELGKDVAVQDEADKVVEAVKSPELDAIEAVDKLEGSVYANDGGGL